MLLSHCCTNRYSVLTGGKILVLVLAGLSVAPKTLAVLQIAVVGLLKNAGLRLLISLNNMPSAADLYFLFPVYIKHS